MQPGKFYWLKTAQGDTWDIQLFDSNYVYQWITETSFGTPMNYKRASSNTNQPMMTRCASGGYPGTTVFVPDTSYYKSTNCAESGPIFNGLALYELWGPYTAGQPGLEPNRPPIGGIIPNNTPVYTLSYRWGCDSSYGNCSKEEYILTQRYGFVQWNFWELVNGSYVLMATSSFNTLRAGTATPSFPCF
jgi:hypothetical protein